MSDRTKLQYDSTNQSEPLRMYLGLSLFPALLFQSQLAAALDVSPPLPFPAAPFLSLAPLAFFLQNASSRARQLRRIELEAAARSLPVAVPSIAGGAVLSSLGELDGRSRALVFRGDDLGPALARARVFRRRFRAAATIVVPVSGKAAATPDAGLWLASVPAAATEQWDDFAAELLANSSPSPFSWFGLNLLGRSFGSGTAPPSLLELFGRSLRPQAYLDLEEADAFDPGTPDERALLELHTSCAFGPPIPKPRIRPLTYSLARPAHRAVYAALTSGSLPAMLDLWGSAPPSPRVSEVLADGGRADPWSRCLADGARPSSLSAGAFDCLVSPDGLSATTSNVEATDPLSPGQTLLAVQEWEKGEGGWEIRSHETVPWTCEAPANGMLRCDARGCVALTRGNT